MGYDQRELPAPPSTDEHDEQRRQHAAAGRLATRTCRQHLSGECRRRGAHYTRSEDGNITIRDATTLVKSRLRGGRRDDHAQEDVQLGMVQNGTNRELASLPFIEEGRIEHSLLVHGIPQPARRTLIAKLALLTGVARRLRALLALDQLYLHSNGRRRNTSLSATRTREVTLLVYSGCQRQTACEDRLDPSG